MARSAGDVAGRARIASNGRLAYEIQRAELWRAWRALQLANPSGTFDTFDGLATAAETTRSTASRFFNGGAVSLPVARRIVAVLRLDFAAVAQPVEPVAAA